MLLKRRPGNYYPPSGNETCKRRLTQSINCIHFPPCSSYKFFKHAVTEPHAISCQPQLSIFALCQFFIQQRLDFLSIIIHYVYIKPFFHFVYICAFRHTKTHDHRFADLDSAVKEQKKYPSRSLYYHRFAVQALPSSSLLYIPAHLPYSSAVLFR